MKKNRKMLGVAAATLLAVAPVVASTVPVNAASITLGTTTTNTTNNAGTTSTQAPTDRPYFTFNNQVIDEATTANPSANVVRTTVGISNGEELSSVTKKLNDLGISFHETNSKSTPLKLSDTDVKNALLQNQITTKEVTEKQKAAKGKKATEVKKTVIVIPSNVSTFNLTLNGTSGTQTATIQIPVVVSNSGSSSTEATDAPVFSWTLNGQNQTAGLNGRVFQVAVNSNFNPTNFTDSEGNIVAISAVQNKYNNTYASITTSSQVNTSEAGRYYNVTLTATGLTGKKTNVTYTVLVAPSSLQTLHAEAGQTTIPTYNIYGDNALPGSTTFKDGEQVYVGDQARTAAGVSYSRVSTKSKNDANSSNVWVKTSALVKPAATEKGESHVVMVASRAYDKNGNYLGHMYDTYTNIDIVPNIVTIKGKTYYKVANKDEYVRVTNITGTQRKLRHNAYIYWSSYRRTPGTGKMYKGQTVTTYGASYRFKNGKKYSRIEGCRNNNKRYIKAVNFY